MVERNSSSSSSSSRPFSGVVICVTGLSKEERKRVKEDTERLGGTYSPTLHSKCTHLILHFSPNHLFNPRKLDHALNNHPDLLLVTLPWFLNSVSLNVRLSESPYSLHNSTPTPHSWTLLQSSNTHLLSGRSLYIDSNVSFELRNKVLDVIASQAAVAIDHWFVGCGADFVVCEASMIHTYIGHTPNIVTPIWILKTFQHRSMQRFVGLSPDLARDVRLMLESLQQGVYEKKCLEHDFICERSTLSQAERVQIVKHAKCGIRNRRTRHIQSFDVPLRPINPSSLLDSICWSISEPTSTAAIYVEPLLSRSDCDIEKHVLLHGQERVESDLPFSNSLRPLTESERNELVFRNHFLTILYPVDRFAEMGPSSRTYFSDMGFTCLQLLDFIHDFYQENMPDHEIEAAIHTDSRHAEQLRSLYCSERTQGCQIMYKRIEFLGSRRSFELLKRVSGDNNSNVYELLIRA